MPEKLRKVALDYHEFPKPGKIAIEVTKATSSPEDLSLAYTPGVAIQMAQRSLASATLAHWLVSR